MRIQFWRKQTLTEQLNVPGKDIKKMFDSSDADYTSALLWEGYAIIAGFIIFTVSILGMARIFGAADTTSNLLGNTVGEALLRAGGSFLLMFLWFLWYFKKRKYDLTQEVKGKHLGKFTLTVPEELIGKKATFDIDTAFSMHQTPRQDQEPLITNSVLQRMPLKVSLQDAIDWLEKEFEAFSRRSMVIMKSELGKVKMYICYENASDSEQKLLDPIEDTFVYKKMILNVESTHYSMGVYAAFNISDIFCVVTYPGGDPYFLNESVERTLDREKVSPYIYDEADIGVQRLLGHNLVLKNEELQDKVTVLTSENERLSDQRYGIAQQYGDNIIAAGSGGVQRGTRFGAAGTVLIFVLFVVVAIAAWAYQTKP